MQTVDQAFEQRYLCSLYNSSEFDDKLLTGGISHPPKFMKLVLEYQSVKITDQAAVSLYMVIQRGSKTHISKVQLDRL